MESGIFSNGSSFIKHSSPAAAAYGNFRLGSGIAASERSLSDTASFCETESFRDSFFLSDTAVFYAFSSFYCCLFYPAYFATVYVPGMIGAFRKSSARFCKSGLPAKTKANKIIRITAALRAGICRLPIADSDLITSSIFSYLSFLYPSWEQFSCH